MLEFKFHDTYKLIDKAEELFSLVVNHSTGEFKGLLSPPSDNSVFAYGRPALGVLGQLSPGGTKIIIHSIDDAGLTIWFSDNDRKPLDSFREFLEEVGKYYCPTKEEVESFCRRNGGYADYW